MPFLVRWPAKIPAGKKADFPVSSIDLFPTIMEATDTALPKDRQLTDFPFIPIWKAVEKRTLIVKLWSGTSLITATHGPLLHYPQGNYKLIKFWEGIYELYDLQNDLAEENNLAESKPGIVKRLDTELLARLKADGAKLPRANPGFLKTNQLFFPSKSPPDYSID